MTIILNFLENLFDIGNIVGQIANMYKTSIQDKEYSGTSTKIICHTRDGEAQPCFTEAVFPNGDAIQTYTDGMGRNHTLYYNNNMNIYTRTVRFANGSEYSETLNPNNLNDPFAITKERMQTLTL